MQYTLGQARCNPAIQVGEAPLDAAVTCVKPDGDLAFIAQQLWQIVERRLRVRRVVENADAEDEIERAVLERELEDVRLRDVNVRPAAYVSLGSLHGLAQIDADDDGAPARSHIRETTHAATDIEHTLSSEQFWRKAGLAAKCARPWRLPSET